MHMFPLPRRSEPAAFTALLIAGSGLTAVFVPAGMIGLVTAAMTYWMIGRFEVAEGSPVPSAA